MSNLVEVTLRTPRYPRWWQIWRRGEIQWIERTFRAERVVRDNGVCLVIRDGTTRIEFPEGKTWIGAPDQ